MPSDRWQLAAIAAAAIAVDPAGLGGLVLRDRPGPVRDSVQTLITDLVGQPVQRLPATLDQAALSAGLDLGETLRTGREVRLPDLLTRAAGALLLVPMAERMQAGVAAAVANAMDAPEAPTIVLMDEGAEPDEAAPRALTDRLAIALALDGVPFSSIGHAPYQTADVLAAKELLARGIDDADALLVLSQLAVAMGITSLRAPLLALRLARVLAALEKTRTIGEPQIALATALCLAPRATALPSPEEQDDAPPPPPDKQQDRDETKPSEDGPIEDRVLDAVAAMLPDLGLSGARQRGASPSTGAGDRKRSSNHGRPVRPRPGKPQGSRLDVFSTLLAAAPWQPLRRQISDGRSGLVVLPQDFRIKQYDRPAESVLIFLVDASGSQAAARMAEAKGAVELMLAEAYRRREKVALIAFRGSGAELVLPPTRSLLQAKRRLAVLPGGGPTPLASALVSGRELAIQLRRRGATPYIVLLTDGRGNVGLDGNPGRAQATEDQSAAARSIFGEGITSALIDTANRPQTDAQALAKTMGARYLPLPRADAHGISRIVRAGLAA